MTKVDQLIEKFKEFKEELNKAICPHTGKDAKLCPEDCPCKKGMKKNVNMSYAPGPNMVSKGDAAGGQDVMTMSEKMSVNKGGQWSIDKVDPEENVNISHPKPKVKLAVGVNKAEDKVMPMEPEKDSKKAAVSGKPYDGSDKNSHK